MHCQLCIKVNKNYACSLFQKNYFDILFLFVLLCFVLFCFYFLFFILFINVSKRRIFKLSTIISALLARLGKYKNLNKVIFYLCFFNLKPLILLFYPCKCAPDFLNSSQKHFPVLPSSFVIIWGKSVKGLMSYDRTRGGGPCGHEPRNILFGPR